MTKGKSEVFSPAIPIRKNTKVAKAVKMYMRKGGATNAEIIAACGGPQLNVLRRIEHLGHKVEITTKKVKGKNVKCYKVILKK